MINTTLNKTDQKKAEKLSLKEILESKGLYAAIRELRTHKDQKKLRLFAADCAERVLYLFEEQHPDDKRPRKAIEAARQFARGEIDKDAMVKAARAAYTAKSAADATAAAAAAAGATAAYTADAAGAAIYAAYSAADAAAYTADAEKRAQEKLFIKYFC